LAIPTDKYRAARLRASHALRAFLQGEAAGGVVLMAAAVLAIVVANSPWSDAYFHALHLQLAGMSLAHWINDGLMAVFFLLVGLEVKREFLAGQLATWSDRLLPGLAAVAGMLVPALVYVACNINSPENLKGWAIPAATDIAFSLGILALLGSRAPASLKVLLTAIAVIDDLLAVVIIALFYTRELSLIPLAASLGGLGLLAGLNRLGVRSLVPYLIIGVAIWYGVLLSGVHATLAGVAVAMTIPLGGKDDSSPLLTLQHAIHPWSAFAIVPIFGFANAGIAFGQVTRADIIGPLPLGVALGLFLGKQVGIFAAIWGMVRLGVAKLPPAAEWGHVYAMAILCGIGFTMSLFIGGLAFENADASMNALKVGVLSGSLLSGIVGALVMRGVKRKG
jgi:NhaA family Na+:H+ antiporter